MWAEEYSRSDEGMQLRDQNQAASTKWEDALAKAAAASEEAVPKPQACRRRLDALSRKSRGERQGCAGVPNTYRL